MLRFSNPVIDRILYRSIQSTNKLNHLNFWNINFFYGTDIYFVSNKKHFSTLLKKYVDEKKDTNKKDVIKKHERIQGRKNDITSKTRLTYFRKKQIDYIIIDDHVYQKLKNVLELYENISHEWIKRELLKKRKNISLYENTHELHTLCINNKFYSVLITINDVEKESIELLIQSLIPTKDVLKVTNEIKSLDVNTLFVLYQIIKKIRLLWKNEKGLLWLNYMEKYIISHICLSLHNSVKNLNETKLEKYHKISRHQYYMITQQLLQELRKEKEQYIRIMNGIISIISKNVHTHYHNYNYGLSISFLEIVNEILSYNLNSFQKNSPCSIKKEPCMKDLLCLQIQNQYFYLNVEEDTLHYVEKEYEIIKNSHIKKKQEKKQKKEEMNIYNHIINETNLCMNQSENNILSDIGTYSIILLTIISKKSKYVEKKLIIDLETILGNINLLMYIHKNYLNISSLISKDDLFCKKFLSNYRNLPDSDSMYFLCFLKYVFYNSKIAVYVQGNQEVEQMIKHRKNEHHQKHRNNEHHRLSKIISFISNIKFLLSLENIERNDTFSEIGKKNEAIEKKNYKEEEQIKKNEIKKINKDLSDIESYIILKLVCEENLWKEESYEFPKDIIYRFSFLLNDLYIQNNTPLRKWLSIYLLKYYKKTKFDEFSEKENVYLQYITAYNWIKNFKKDINDGVSEEYENIFNMCMSYLEYHTHNHIKEKEQNEIKTVQHNSYDCIYHQNAYLHVLNILHYFLELCKKNITNEAFVNQVSNHFQVALCLINKYVEYYMNGSEQFVTFVNNCVHNITKILIIHKYFNIVTEELTEQVFTFLNNVHRIVHVEEKRNFLLYLKPFLQNMNHKNSCHVEQMIKSIEESLKEHEKQRNLTELSDPGNQTMIRLQREEKKYVKKEKNSEELTQYNELICNEDSCNVNIEQEKGNIKLYSQNETDDQESAEIMNENDLRTLLIHYKKEKELIRKENVLLKSKLNHIILNFEQFLSSHVSLYISQYQTVQIHKEYEQTKNEEINNHDNTAIDNIATKEIIKKNRLKEKEETKNENSQNGNLNIQFDFQKVQATDEYFDELKRYEQENYRNMNNILINMYLCNPYVSIKSKEIQMKNTKHKTMIILPHDAYKHMRTVMNKKQYKTTHNIIIRLRYTFYVLFCKLKHFLYK